MARGEGGTTMRGFFLWVEWMHTKKIVKNMNICAGKMFNQVEIKA